MVRNDEPSEGYLCLCVFRVYAVCGIVKDTMLESAGGGR